MYENFYGLTEKPFHIVPNPNYLYLSPKHRNALTHLEYGLMERVGFILLTGEIGTGKTTLIRYLLNQMEADMEVAVIFNTNVSPDQLLSLILNEYEINADAANKVKTLDFLYQFLLEKFAAGKRVLLIIDEAQNLTNEALEEVRMLSNLQSEDQLLLQIMLVGHPELKEKLRQPALAQFTQRIAVNYHLSALAREDTGHYIAFRLEKAGAHFDIFTPEAVDLIYKASDGIPRSINLICDSALTYGYADDLKVVDATVVEQVLRDKGGLGVASAPETQAATLPIPEQPAATGTGNQNRVRERIEQLESSVSDLGTRLQEMSRHAPPATGGLSANQFEKLRKLLFRERRRNAMLLTQYSQLRGKYVGLREALAHIDKLDNLDADAPQSSPESDAAAEMVMSDPELEMGMDAEAEAVLEPTPVLFPAEIELSDDTTGESADDAVVLPDDLDFPSEDRHFEISDQTT